MMYSVRNPRRNSAEGIDGPEQDFAQWVFSATGNTGIKAMFGHSGEHRLDIIDADMIATLQQRPGLGSGNQPLAGPWGQPMGISTTGSSQIQHISDQIV